MNKLIVASTLALALFACENSGRKSGFELKGTFTNSNNETIYLEKLTGPQPVVVDSTTIDEKGNFEFKEYDPKIGFYRIKVTDANFAMLVLDSADKVTVTGDMKDLGNSYKVDGSPETVLFMAYNEISKHDRTRVDSLSRIFENLASMLGLDQLQAVNPELAAKRGDSLSKTLEGVYMEIVNQASERMAVKIRENLNMFSTIMAIQALDPEKYLDVYQELDKNLMKKFPKNQNILMFHEHVLRTISSREKALALKEGSEAPEINLPDVNGNPLTLSSLRGKVVLIDFWASWCGPCRKEMPAVVKAYAKYKSKGFEIYGVSLDKTKENWVEAIQKDGITWPQVSDLKFWDCEAAKAYNVEGIPFTVLIDKEGKILAKNLRGDDLEKAIEKALAGAPIN